LVNRRSITTLSPAVVAAGGSNDKLAAIDALLTAVKGIVAPV
jgi:hypothetical protein